MLWILIILMILVTLSLCYYRWQIRDMKRQLEEITRQNTNQLVTQDIYTPELDQLVEKINQTIRKERWLRQELLRKEDLNTKLMTNLSHDVRTPLTSLAGYIQLLEKTDDAATKEHYYALIYSRINHLTNLLDELFLYMKLADASYEIAMERLDLVRLLKQEVLAFYDQFQEKGIAMHLNLTEENVFIEGNTNLLARIFNNLLKNALDHEAEELTITLFPDVETGPRIRFENPYSDESLPDPSLLTERFYQADSARSKDNAGLGLSMVKSAMEKMGGSFDISTNHRILQLTLRFPPISSP